MDSTTNRAENNVCPGDGSCFIEQTCICQTRNCLCRKRNQYIADNRCIYQCVLMKCPNCFLMVPRHMLITTHQLCEKCV